MQTQSLPDIGQEPAIDTTPEALAVRFGERAKQLIRDGREPRTVARLAASFAERVLAQRSPLSHCALSPFHRGGHIWVETRRPSVPFGECQAHPEVHS